LDKSLFFSLIAGKPGGRDRFDAGCIHHHAFSRNQIFPDAAGEARHSRALSRRLLSLLRKAYVGSAVLAALSLASKFRLLVKAGPPARVGPHEYAARCQPDECAPAPQWQWMDRFMSSFSPATHPPTWLGGG